MPWGLAAAALGVGGSIFGGITGASAAAQAARLQAQAANRATDLQQQIYGQTTTNLAPYLDAGTAALSALQTGLGSYQGQLNPNAPFLQSGLTAPGGAGAYPTYPTFPTLPAFNPTGFQQSPGYQFQFGEAMRAAEDLGTRSQGTISGNTLSELQRQGTGLAQQDYYNWLQNVYTPTYQSQLQNTLAPYNAAVGQYGAGVSQWQNLLNAYNLAQSNQFNRLAALTSGGQSAAAQQGNFGQNFGAQAGSNILGAGNAGAAGTVGAANALTGGLNAASTDILTQQLLNRSPSGGGAGIGNFLTSLIGGGSSPVNPTGGYYGTPGNYNYYGPGVNPANF